MESTRHMLNRFVLYEECAEDLGERLASDVAIAELIETLGCKTSKEVFGAWVKNRIDNPTPAILNELNKWLEPRRVSESKKHSLSQNRQLQDAFRSRLSYIRSM